MLSALFAHSMAAAKEAQAKTPAPHQKVLETQTMRYDVYAGGFHVVSADLLVDLKQQNRYTLRLGAYTHGFLAKLAPWNGVFETSGWYDPKKAIGRPEKHQSITTWQDEEEIKTYLYDKDGSFREYRIKDPDNDGTPKEVESELTDQTTDALSATLAVMNHVAHQGQCEGAEDVFDGKRRYTLSYQHQKEVTLQASALNVYAGPAVECTIEVTPKGGAWHKKPRGWMSIQEQGRERGTMPTMWMAVLDPGQPAVPVKIRVKTEYGTLFMHLTRYQGKTKKLSLPE